MKKDTALTFRLPVALRRGLERARGTQTAAKYVVALLARALLVKGRPM